MNKLLQTCVRIGLLGLTLLFVVNCADENPVSDQQTESIAQNIHLSNQGPIALLKVDPAKDPTLALQKKNKSVWRVTGLIEADHDGELELDDPKNGESKVKFEKNSLPHDMNIRFDWAKKKYTGQLKSMEDSLKQISFNEPVKVELTFERAFLGHTDPSKLVFCVKNGRKWEVVDAEINSKNFKIKAKLYSFGKFGLFEKDGENLTRIFRLGDHRHYANKFIKTKSGGKIKIGDKIDGESVLDFPKNALPEDLTILFDWTASGTFEGTLNNMEFGPHGTYFNQPVEVKLSYKMADLTDVVEEDLRVFYFNEDLQEWEFIGGTVDVDKKIITVFLEHFSRYAVAYSR